MVFCDKEQCKMNRSVRRTQRELRRSLLELIKEKPIMRITAKEIYERADIGRTTFYAHYKDQFDILNEIEQKTIEKFEEILKKHEVDKKASSKEIVETAIEILKEIADNLSILNILLSENGNIIFQKKFYRHFIAHYQKKIQKKSDYPEDTHMHECYSVFLVNGYIGLIQHWLKNDKNIPVPVLAKMLVNLTKDIDQRYNV